MRQDLCEYKSMFILFIEMESVAYKNERNITR